MQILDYGIEEVLLDAAPESFAFGGIKEIGPVANDDEIEAGDHEQDLVAGAGGRERVARDLWPDGVKIRVPAQTACRLRIAGRPIRLRRTGVAQHRLDPFAVDELLALPVTLSQHQPADPGDRPRGVATAAPVGDEFQALDVVGLAVTYRPFAVLDADGSHDALPKQGPDVGVLGSPQAGGNGVRQHRHAGIAVRVLGAGREYNRRLVARQRERVRVLAPEAALPAGQLHVRNVVLLGVLDAG